MPPLRGGGGSFLNFTFAASPAAGPSFPLWEKKQKHPQGTFRPLRILRITGVIYLRSDVPWWFYFGTFVGAPDFCVYPRAYRSAYRHTR